ncbi:MAG TPA: hypothetical protein VIF10_01870 [Methylobacter sp.]|jgi:hypothetical protein
MPVDEQIRESSNNADRLRFAWFLIALRKRPEIMRINSCCIELQPNYKDVSPVENTGAFPV